MNSLMRLFQIELLLQPENLSPKESKIAGRIYWFLVFFAASGFIHYMYSVASIAIGGLLFCVWPTSRRCILKRKTNGLVFLFAAITGTVAVIYGNLPGLGATILFVCMFVIAFVAREFATKQMFENIFSFTILASYFSVAAAVVEKVFFVAIGQADHRCSGVSSNPNFYGIMATIVILLCIHKAVTVKKNAYVFYISAAVNGVGLALCGSTSQWLVVFFFLFFYFLFNKNYKVFTVFTVLGVLAIIAVFTIPGLMPRLQERPWEGSGRFNIYQSAIGTLDESPWFGRGFLSYRYWRYKLGPELFPQKVSLCHNITLDCLLSHGIVGTALIETVLGIYIANIIRCKKMLKNHKLSSYSLPLILTVLITITLYGMVDTTVIWTQSGILVLYVFAAIGVDERAIANTQTEEIVIEEQSLVITEEPKEAVLK